MKIKFLIILGFVLMTGMFVTSSAHASFSDAMLIQVQDNVKKMYYSEKNVTSVLLDPDSASVIFETGSNALLEMKVPKVFKEGPGLFVLQNGEEIDSQSISDDCFYYVTIETQMPEKIEIIFVSWPEHPETINGCETVNVSPLIQTKLGVDSKKIQCRESLILLLKYDGSPACVTIQTAEILKHRGWADRIMNNFCFGEQLPVCGKDNITYGNQCYLERENVGLKHVGECNEN